MERISHFVDIDGPVHYVDYGGSGDAIVMLHGLGGSHLNWDRIAPGLVDRYHPYSIDMRGFGLTPLGEGDAAVGTQVTLVAHFIREIAGGKAIVFGNSMGGTIAMLLADAHPDLVAGLVLFAPGLPPQSPKVVNRRNLRYLGTPLLPGIGERHLRRLETETPVEERVDLLIEAMTAHPDRIDDATRAAFIEMRRLRADMEWAIPAYCQALRSITGLMTKRGRFRDMVHRIAAPTLIIHGMLDDTVPFDAAEWLAAERPDWRFAPLADCGHVPQIELPKRSMKIIDEWLASLETAGV